MALIQSTAIPSGATDYELEQGLKFEDGNEPKLTFTPSTAGNRKKITVSVWAKRGKLGASNSIISSGGRFDTAVVFNSNDKIEVFTNYAEVYRGIQTSAVFRDNSSWYHIVATWDTNNSTSTDRHIVWVNGVRQAVGSETTMPQNGSTELMNTTEHTIGTGGRYQNQNQLDGYLAEMHVIDGQVLTPSSFGETGDYGEWKPIEYSGTYGTNGFYLPFKQDYTVEGFSAVTYKGNGGTQYIGGTGFSPDLVWQKARSQAYNHGLYDSVRGVSGGKLESSTTDAEQFDAGFLSAFNNDGFTLKGSNGTNQSGETYVAWNWDMGADTPTGFGCVTYTGNDGTNVVSGFGFQPDLIWTKGRSIAEHHCVFDSVRGHTTNLKPNLTNAEAAQSKVDSFNPDGFTISTSDDEINDNGSTYVAWGWDMGGTTATNTSGTISSQVRANPTYGQSVVTYDGNGTNNATVGHGLSSAPELVIIKRTDASANWNVGANVIGWANHLYLNTTSGQLNGYNPITGQASTLEISNDSDVNNSSGSYVAYCFDSVSGYSKIGSYTGNGSSTGPTITTGFRPAFVMVKITSDTGGWEIWDNTRNPLNPVTKSVQANLTNAEQTSGRDIEFTDTGFQIKNTTSNSNGSGETYIYMAFAGGMDSISDYNDTGSIDSRVKANPTYGQSIVSWTGNATSGATVGHGLTSAPEMVIVKSRTTSATDWWTYHTSTGATHALRLNSTATALDDASIWNDTAPTNALFSLGNYADINKSGEPLIAYCFHSVTGYSKFGTWTGNGSATGPSVTTGFKPAFILWKNTENTNHWGILDTTRSPTNPADESLYPNLSNAEGTNDADRRIDFNDTGFQIKSAHDEINRSGHTFIYMTFADKREYAYWLDQSGNNNDWTSNNLTESDISVDSPSNNFATLNPLDSTNTTFSEGNLEFSVSGSSHGAMRGTFGASLGKWYWEVLVLPDTTGTSTSRTMPAISNSDSNTVTDWAGSKSGSWSYYFDGVKYNNGSSSSYGASYTNGDIISVALDLDAGTVAFYKNGVSQGTAYSSLPNDTYFPLFGHREGQGVANFGQDSSFAGNKTAQGNQDGNDIGDFYYTPPTGFLALCTKNLPDVAVVPSEHFNTVLYSGSGNAQSITGLGLTPDMTWIKSRSNANSHVIHDNVRSTNGTAYLLPDLTTAEQTGANGFVSLDSDGFSLNNAGGGGEVNGSGRTYVAWNWKANGSGSSNSNGSITSTVSANVDAGFSIVGYEATGSAGTIGHGLSKTPEMIIVKHRDQSGAQWIVYYGDNTDYLVLQGTNATTDGQSAWNDTSPTSTVFSVGANGGDTNNTSGGSTIAYCFHSVDGYLKVGSYTGNGNADGTFVYTGFRVKWLLHKKTNGSANWIMTDAIRNTSNPVGKYLMPNSSNAEADGTSFFDYTSNGFKLRTSGGGQNGSGDTHIFIAFAETPFKYSNAR